MGKVTGGLKVNMKMAKVNQEYILARL